MRRSLGSGLLIAALFASVTPMVAGEVSNVTSFNFMYFKQPFALTIDKDQIAVVQGGAARDADVKAGLARLGVDTSAVESAWGDRWWMVPTPTSQRSVSGVHALVTAAAADPTIGFVSPVFRDPDGRMRLVTRDIIVRFRPEVNATLAETVLASVNAGTILERDFASLSNTYYVRTSLSDGFTVLDVANNLAAYTEVEFAEPNFGIEGRVSLIPNDPYFSLLWGMNQANDIDLDCPAAWDITTGSANVKIVVLDLGIQQNHPDINQVAGQDFTGRNTPGGGPYNSCDNHGTCVAGCITAIINNNQGVVGVAPGCKSVSAKIGEAATPCTTSFYSEEAWLTSALGWAYGTIGAKVTNSSFSYGSSSAVTLAYNNARAAGLVNFAATGNEGASSISYPSSLASVNAVGSINSSGGRSSFSNYGDGIDFSAPGENITTTDRTGSAGEGSGDYATVDGTSFASPYACGVAALAFSMNINLTPSQVEQIMQGSCMNLGAAGYDTTFGWGLVNAAGTVAALTSPPGAFSLLTPAASATGVSTIPTFTWSASTNATSYTLTLDINSGFDSPEVQVVSGIIGTTYTWAGTALRQECVYYWKVQAVNLAGTHDSTPVSQSFTTFRDCNGNGIDDAAEIAANPALDCNGNGWLDSCDVSPITYVRYSPYYTPLGVGYPKAFTLTTPPDASGTVTLSFEAFGDLNFTSENVAVNVNGVSVGTIYATAGFQDCVSFQHDSLTMTAAAFNAAKAGGNAIVNMVPSAGVNPTQCTTATWIQVTVSYTRVPNSADANSNGIPDECEPAACCLSGGTCQLKTSAQCASAGGTWQGLGTTCTPNPCLPPQGACCLSDGTCQVKSSAECTTLGGTWQGAGTTCSPNPCPQPGACCFADGTCQSKLSAACTAAGGTWLGAGTTCSPNPCPQPGACCFSSGTCQLKLSAECTTAGGTWQGAGTTCSPNPCPQPGACCFADGTCQSKLSAACTAAGGTWLGAGTTCSPTNPCPQPGACCFSSGTCQLKLSAECTTAGGTWQGAGTTCSPTNPCPQPGACCFADGTCQSKLSAECASLGGTWQGAGTTCSPTNPCPQPGACCFADGSCQLKMSAECTSLGGTWQGAGTTCSPTNPCPQPGACCFADGSCQLKMSAECTTLGGTWQGAGTTCSPTNPCQQPQGACCFADGSCQLKTSVECATAGGTWQGAETTCSPTNPCQQPQGACCHTNGSCESTTAAQCAAEGGRYQGDGTTCSANSCVCRGDTDCDGQVSFSDIDYFVAAIPDNVAGWQNLYASRHGGELPPCSFANCDINGDGHVGFSDIDPFVALIPSACP